MNTCMQCLASIPEFNSYFFEKKFKKDSKSGKSSLTACEAIYDFVSNYSTENEKYFQAPGSLYKVCHSFLERNTQHDCQVID